jgi:single-strand DNA-binding protein
MRSVNKVILLGNVTRDPQVRTTQSGQIVCTFGIATNRDWITSDGRKQTSAEYTEVVAWAKLADICEKYIRKGKLVYVEGYLKTRTWDTPEGTRRFKTEIVIQDMIMVGPRQDHDDANFEEALIESTGSDGGAFTENDDYEMEKGEPKDEEPVEESDEKDKKKEDLIDKDLGL